MTDTRFPPAVPAAAAAEPACDARAGAASGLEPHEPGSAPAARAGRRRLVRRALVGACIAGFVGVAADLGHTVSEDAAVDELRRVSTHRLDLFASTVEATIKRLEHVPPTVQLSQEVQALLHEPDSPPRVRAASDYLRRLNAYLGSVAIYVANDRGIVVASSNGDNPDDSLLGADLSFRPYFLEALSGRVGRHFAIGIQGNQPGYFVSHPVYDGGRVTGIAAIKISLESINALWATLGAPALIADTHRVVILSSRPAWRYTALTDLPVERRVDLQLARLYNDARVGRFPLPLDSAFDEDGQIVETLLPAGVDQAASSDDAGALVLGRAIDGMDWRLLTFSDMRPVRERALTGAFVGALGAALLALGALFLAQRRRILRQRRAARLLLERANAELECKVRDRTADLTAANQRLRAEIAERAHAEQTLRATQAELVQAAKMAMLGQIATGITHELTQPLGAIRTLSGNAIEFMRRGDLAQVPGNLGIIARLADQMGGIVQPLKRFARKSRPLPEPADIAHAMANTLVLYEFRLRKENIVVRNHCVPGQAVAWCDPNRLEQVLSNLVGNAIDAMAGREVRVLGLDACVEPAAPGGGGAQVRVEVSDTGCGFSTAAAEQIFEAFYTSKPSGAGLGLGLTISRDIVREFEGELDGESRDGGACFTLRLPAAPAAAHRGPAAGTAPRAGEGTGPLELAA